MSTSVSTSLQQLVLLVSHVFVVIVTDERLNSNCTTTSTSKLAISLDFLILNMSDNKLLTAYVCGIHTFNTCKSSLSDVLCSPSLSTSAIFTQEKKPKHQTATPPAGQEDNNMHQDVLLTYRQLLLSFLCFNRPRRFIMSCFHLGDLLLNLILKLKQHLHIFQ